MICLGVDYDFPFFFFFSIYLCYNVVKNIFRFSIYFHYVTYVGTVNSLIYLLMNIRSFNGSIVN